MAANSRMQLLSRLSCILLMETEGGEGGGRVALKVSDRHIQPDIYILSVPGLDSTTSTWAGQFSLYLDWTVQYYLYLGWTVLPLPGLDSTTFTWAGHYYLCLRWTVLPLPGLDSTTSTWAVQYYRDQGRT